MAIAATIITYQDFRHRAISWWTPLAMLAAALWLATSAIGMGDTLSQWGINVLFLTVQWGLLALAFGLGRGQWKIFDHLMGWGDVLFLVCISALFSTVNFLLWYCMALVMSLAGFGIYVLMSGKKESSVPLAGTLTICATIFIIGIAALGYSPWDELPIYTWLP